MALNLACLWATPKGRYIPEMRARYSKLSRRHTKALAGSAAWLGLMLALGLGATTLDSIAVARAAQSQPALRWYRGNTHTHTLNSDGDSSPDEVARWYREHGYQFLVLTDHNFLTDVEGINALMGANDRFLVIKGEEVTDRFANKSIHVNGLDVKRLVSPQGGANVVEMLQRNVDAIRAAEGVPHINHPNFTWAITADELAQVRRTRLFEVFNGHPQVNNLGGGGVPGLEAAWDTILSRGVLLYGIAVDDAHHFKRPWDRAAARPGQGWVVVRAERLGASEILQAMERGDFYATTGVELADYEATPKTITISIKEHGVTRYRVLFIGRGGRVLRESASSPARYDISGSEGYVRAKVIDSNGYVAWTQPVLVGGTGAESNAIQSTPGTRSQAIRR